MFAVDNAFQASSHISILRDTFQAAHLVDEGFHNDDCHNGKQVFVIADSIISNTTKRLLSRSMFSFELSRKSKRPP